MFLPVNLNVQDRLCLVVGGGPVALRKASKLLEFGARVRVVAAELKEEGDWPLDKVELARRNFEAGDLSEDVFLVIAATDDQSLNGTVAGLASKRRILVQRADEAKGSDFIFPAVIRRGDLTVSCATGGVAPALSVKLKQRLEPVVGPEYGEFCKMVGELRAQSIEKLSRESRSDFLAALVNSDILELLISGNKEAASSRAQEILERFAPEP